jgi:hypothetical protein
MLPGWETVEDQTGNQCYYNKELNVKQWYRPAPSEGAVVFTPVSSSPPHIDQQVQSNALRARRTPALMRTAPVLMTDTTLSESVDPELVIFSHERQILEITAVGQATSTQAASASTSLPPGERGLWPTAGISYSKRVSRQGPMGGRQGSDRQ